MSDISKECKELEEKTRGFTDALTALSPDREKTYNFWKSLRKANIDYLDIDVGADGTFIEFMKYNYGIQLYTDDSGNYTAKFDVIDDHQYLIFKIKYA